IVWPSARRYDAARLALSTPMPEAFPAAAMPCCNICSVCGSKRPADSFWALVNRLFWVATPWGPSRASFAAVWAARLVALIMSDNWIIEPDAARFEFALLPAKLYAALPAPNGSVMFVVAGIKLVSYYPLP